jgi:hypothetical protein
VASFGVRGEVLRLLRADPVWLEKAQNALSRGDFEELQRVLVAFCRLKGFEVVEV